MCPRELKIPEMELSFVCDQRQRGKDKGKMAIGSKDHPAMKVNSMIKGTLNG
jgi:hypothetical protein